MCKVTELRKRQKQLDEQRDQINREIAQAEMEAGEDYWSGVQKSLQAIDKQPSMRSTATNVSQTVMNLLDLFGVSHMVKSSGEHCGDLSRDGLYLGCPRCLLISLIGNPLSDVLTEGMKRQRLAVVLGTPADEE